MDNGNTVLRIGAIVAARMSSRRLPGKPLRPVAGKPLLQYLLERLERSRCLEGVVVATSTAPSDDAIQRFCEAAGVECQRPSPSDAAGRCRDVLDRSGFDAFLRVEADAPLLDPRLVEHAVGLYREHATRAAGADLVTNTHPPTFPGGQSVEIVAAAAFRRAEPRIRTPGDREDVTRWFYRHAGEWRIVSFTAAGDWSDVQLAVDTPGDLVRFREVIGRMARPQWTYGWREAIALQRGLEGPPSPHQRPAPGASVGEPAERAATQERGATAAGN